MPDCNYEGFIKGYWKGTLINACTQRWRYKPECRAQTIDVDESLYRCTASVLLLSQTNLIVCRAKLDLHKTEQWLRLAIVIDCWRSLQNLYTSWSTLNLDKIKCRIGTDPFIITPKMSLLPQSIFVVADVFMRTSAVYIYAESASIQRGVAISGARVTMRPFFSPKKKSSVSLLRGLIKGEPFWSWALNCPLACYEIKSW